MNFCETIQRMYIYGDKMSNVVFRVISLFLNNLLFRLLGYFPINKFRYKLFHRRLSVGLRHSSDTSSDR